MIYDYVVDAETGADYIKEYFDDYNQALTYYQNAIKEGWDFICLRKRTMNPVTLGDDYEDLLEHEAA